jgi:hypothetical protein
MHSGATQTVRPCLNGCRVVAKALGGVGERLVETCEFEQRCGNSASVRRTRALFYNRAFSGGAMLSCVAAERSANTYSLNVDIHATQLHAVLLGTTAPLRASAPASEG